MTSPQFDKLVRILHERRRVDLSVPIEVVRKAMDAAAFPVGDDVEVGEVEQGGPAGEWLVPPDAHRGRVLLYLHGGGYVTGSPVTHRKLAADVARVARARCLLLDYRLAPEHVHPAAVCDAVGASRWLLDQGGDPAGLGVVGDSAGGGLALATLVAVRDRGDPLPAAVVCMSPWVDLARPPVPASAPDGPDPVLSRRELERFRDLYVGGMDPRHPWISPVHADLRDLPPTLLHVGDAEVLLDDAVDLYDRARAAGVDVTLEVWPGMIHVWQVFAGRVPESTAAIARIGEFLDAHLPE